MRMPPRSVTITIPLRRFSANNIPKVNSGGRLGTEESKGICNSWVASASFIEGTAARRTL